MVQTTRTLDGTVSDNVGEKNELKEWIHGVLISLSNVLEGNFPNTYHEQLRKWVFKKRNINSYLVKNALGIGAFFFGMMFLILGQNNPSN